MKIKHALRSFLFGLIVFFAILLQSAHSFHHLEEAFSTEECHHNYSENDSQITHSHEFENCFVCEFTFSNSVKKEFTTFYFKNVEISSLYSFAKSREITSFFCGALFALRAPPSFVV
jgi:hypothetical protein